MNNYFNTIKEFLPAWTEEIEAVESLFEEYQLNENKEGTPLYTFYLIDDPQEGIYGMRRYYTPNIELKGKETEHIFNESDPLVIESKNNLNNKIEDFFYSKLYRLMDGDEDGVDYIRQNLSSIVIDGNNYIFN